MATLVNQDVSIRHLAEGELPLLEQMYESFAPRHAAMGLPPEERCRRRAWLENLVHGMNLVAVRGARIAGHLALMPCGRAAEMAVFVHQDFRRQGIGTALTRAAMEEAGRLGIRLVWVLVSSENFIALNGLRRMGFHIAWESMGEVQLVYRLAPATEAADGARNGKELAGCDTLAPARSPTLPAR